MGQEFYYKLAYAPVLRSQEIQRSYSSEGVVGWRASKVVSIQVFAAQTKSRQIYLPW